ncbi:MAG: NUDIX hydrolase [Desulfovibrionales bacterium]|nr:NUDIX hydrolase [Desulfovibrionales bacterium]
MQRANPPSQNMWAIPGGKIKLGETLQQAAEREVLEETGIVVRAGRPVLTFDLIERDNLGNIIFHYVIVDVLAEYISGNISAGGDAREAVWAHKHELDKFDLNRATLNLFLNL